VGILKERRVEIKRDKERGGRVDDDPKGGRGRA